MTRSYFKAIIWDNSNYVQEQRRSKQLVPPLNSSEPLAKRRLLCVEGGGGRGGGRKWEAEGGEVEEAELLTRDTEGLPRAELLQKAELSVPGATRKPGCGGFLDGGEGALSPRSLGCASVAHTGWEEPFPLVLPLISSLFRPFLLSVFPSLCCHMPTHLLCHLITSPSTSQTLSRSFPLLPTPSPLPLHPRSLSILHLPTCSSSTVHMAVHHPSTCAYSCSSTRPVPPAHVSLSTFSPHLY